jgi:hypothetical protein
MVAMSESALGPPRDCCKKRPAKNHKKQNQIEQLMLARNSNNQSQAESTPPT